MTRLNMTQRLARLERASDHEVPLYIQQWLGETLSPDQVASATAEWKAVRDRPLPSPTTFSADVRGWFAERGAA